ncbi:hypothetical protein [Glycomyces tenuis]|uniref:hypothetical protein n=1 Tax=Glycomyces tenuis TaxID=58116 RepID=UPI000419FFB2|nr:hypothetical protein [Glycomyces tenuis]
MNLPPSHTPTALGATEIELLNCLIAAPSQEVAAQWLGYSPTHLRRLLKDLRNRFAVDTNAQLIVLASVSGAIDPAKVLPFRHLDPAVPARLPAGGEAVPEASAAVAAQGEPERLG